jgi:hypothetical protein
MNAWIYVGGMAVLAAGPIVAVVLGNRAFDADESEPETCTDDTIELERVTDANPYLYQQ